MILLCGISSESPLAMVKEALDTLGGRYFLFDQRRSEGTYFELCVANTRVTGALRMGNRTLRLEDVHSVYTRLIGDESIPGLENESPSCSRRQHCRALLDALTQWLEVAPARVVNRTGAMGSNFSKSFQLQLIREHGFCIPETLITNDPELVMAFREQHKRVIYKSISAVRSIVQLLEDDDVKRLQRIRWCPTQFQQYVEGVNVRVHTIGTTVFATSIKTEAMDYRYATRLGYPSPELEPMEISDELAERCVNLARDLNLEMAGIDLKIDNDGNVYCFEVNPSPAFSYYEASTEQPMAETVARYLAGAS